MQLIYLDLAPAYIPFMVQCTDGTGLKIDPTVDNLIIYEEGGGDAAFDSTTIAGSPFDPAQVNTKTGLWGVLVAKSALTAGKWYIALWEMTVDGIQTSKEDIYFACNSSQFKADVSNLDVAVSSRLATAGYTAPPTAQNNADAVLDTATEGTWTMRKILRIVMAAFGGKSSGGGTGSEVYRDVGDTKPRISVTTSNVGNRSAVTLDGD
jgi:hypothetical protein